MTLLLDPMQAPQSIPDLNLTKIMTDEEHTSSESASLNSEKTKPGLWQISSNHSSEKPLRNSPTLTKILTDEEHTSSESASLNLGKAKPGLWQSSTNYSSEKLLRNSPTLPYQNKLSWTLTMSPAHWVPTESIPCYTISYRAISYNTIPDHTLSNNTKPYHTIHCNTIPYHAITYKRTLPHKALGRAGTAWHIPCPTVPCPTTRQDYHTIPDQTIQYHTVSYQTISHHTPSHHTRPYHKAGLLSHTMSCPTWPKPNHQPSFFSFS